MPLKLDQLIGNQISDNNKKGLGYNVVPPLLTGLFAPPSIDLSNSGLEKFKQPEFEGYGVKVISVTTVKGKRMTSDVGEQRINVVKPTAYWAWRPKIKMINHVYKNTGSCISLAIPGQTTTLKSKDGGQASVMISDAEEYLISEDPVKQGRMEETEIA
ncbi:hypothetical protein Tco_0533331 [Tanacetum coccineum]